MWLFFRCINRCVVSIYSASRSTDCLYWLFLQLLDLWKCTTKDLMSDEEDVRVSGRIVRPPSFRSQELTELCATLQLRLEVILKHMATHHRRLQNGPNSDRMLPLTYSRQTLHGAVGFWASRELLVCCVDRLCFVPSCVFALKKLLLNKQRLPGKFSFTY